MPHKLDNNLFLIDLDQKRPGFRKFIASWFLRHASKNILIDPGPSSTIPLLVNALKALNISRLDYILLTHIHIDHAGGVGKLLKHYPSTPVLCHPKAIQHLIDPQKLWLGTRKVLGDLADLYGPIEPVPAPNLHSEASVRENDLEINIIETPGHAAHHISFLVGEYLFAGEALGVTLPGTSQLYLRPATPPVFIYEIYRDTIRTLAELDHVKVCFGHYGLQDNLHLLTVVALDQLDFWMDRIQREYRQDEQDKFGYLFKDITAGDPYMRAFANLPGDIQERERVFIENSIKGMLGYIEKSMTVEV